MRSASAVTWWKAALVAFVAFALFHDLWAVSNWARKLSDGGRAGTLAFARGAWTPEGYRIVSLQPRSPLVAAGAREGDRVAFDHPGDRVRRLSVDETIGLTIVGADGAGRHVEVRPVAAEAGGARQVATMAIEWLASLLMLVVGVLIGWRRADNVAMRLFSASLVSQTLVVFIPLLPGGEFQSASLRVLAPLLALVAYDGFLFFVLAYVGAFERRWVRIAFAVFVVADASLALWTIVGQAPGFLPLLDQARTLGALLGVASAATCIVSLGAAWWRSHGARRQRLGWMSLCLGALYAAYIGSNLVDGERARAWYPLVAGVVVAAANAGLGYAVLRHRILDVGFAVNRALVFGTTSLILAALFILSSQLINRMIRFDARTESPAVDVAIAVCLALVGRQIARWVDPRVRRMFFRRWHQAAARLQAFRAEQLHDLAPGVLEPALLDALREYSGAAAAALYVHDAGGALRRRASTMDGAPGLLAPTHPLTVALRASQKPRHLDAQAGVPAVLALPMSARGRLVGAVLMGPKPDDDPYRPDEVAQLATSVQHVGLELELRRLGALESVGEMHAAAKPRRKPRKRGGGTA